MNHPPPDSQSFSPQPHDLAVDAETVDTESTDWNAAGEAARQAVPSRSAEERDNRADQLETIRESAGGGWRIIEIPIGRGQPSEQAVNAFEADMKTVQTLKHAGVVRVQLERSEDRLKIAMVATPKTSLESRLTDRFQPWTDVCDLLQPVVETLNRLHAANVAHGGLRPCRILIGPDGPVLTDVAFALVE